eukprot:CAMPEP_0168607464 /NCGR_PEP_ID=MMETSP0449_2-20121227/56_1 /TAXON_ID=1082188 /ORGANISM="Strombidium rassoulzadegani, Strain ras09" /LENGTH=148 /DNA_ID=CAMNT_0008647281 /DNA_START=126 /DNA_END=573 /DNA_ORIENTATION=-
MTQQIAFNPDKYSMPQPVQQYPSSQPQFYNQNSQQQFIQTANGPQSFVNSGKQQQNKGNSSPSKKYEKREKTQGNSNNNNGQRNQKRSNEKVSSNNQGEQKKYVTKQANKQDKSKAHAEITKQLMESNINAAADQPDPPAHQPPNEQE